MATSTSDSEIRKLIVPILNGSIPYTDQNSQKAILVYAKKDESGEWIEDGLVNGDLAGATLTYLSGGIWVMEMDSSALDSERPDREDKYIVKTGVATNYTGGDDTNWTAVTGFDPISFGTITLPPSLLLKILNNELPFATMGADKIDWGQLPDTIDAVPIDWNNIADLLNSEGEVKSEKFTVNYNSIAAALFAIPEFKAFILNGVIKDEAVMGDLRTTIVSNA